MSKTIDERVLEMRFDNSHFEKNVATSMSTLDKLKAKLNFKGAGDSLSSLDKATKNVNLNGLSSACDTVHAKFSALEVMGVTALANITNSAVNAGKRMVSALTIDPIKTGLSEYETQINSVQTILANTQSKGSTIDDVNRALDELNVYADKTIYNFTEMTRNIGTFTAAGVDLDQSVSAIKGIANLAAVSGSSSQQASTAMYQLSQALATGTVRLQDWNSVVNAGMGGELFQNALKRTAENMGTNVDAMIEKYGSFRDSLTQGEWLTTEVLTKTLEQFTMSAEEGSKEWNEFKKSLKADGYTEQQAEEILKMANTATEAATKVKTFTQLWDVMKEAAQSGWAQTWEIIFGDLEEAKALFSPIADFFTGENGIITTMSNARNNLLESAFGKSLTGLAKKFDDMLAPAKKATEAVNKTVETITDLGGIVDEVILGKFGNGKDRYDALTEAGENYYRIQNKVNEKLGDSYRYTDEQIAAQDKLLGSQKKTNEAQEKSSETQAKVTEETKKQIKAYAKLSNEKLREKGFTEEQIKAYDELRSTADKLGLSTDDLIDNIDKINGRWLLINSFKNIGKGLVSVFKAIGDAWRDAFPPMQADTLFNIIAGFHKFTTYLVPTEDTVKNLTRTLKGLFAILDIIASVTGGVFKFGLQIVKELFHALGVSGAEVLEYTAKIGDSIVAFRNWFEEHNLVTKAIKKIVPAIVDVVKNVAKMIEEFMQLPKVRQAIENVKQTIADMVSVGEYIINGLVQGIEGGISKVIEKMFSLGSQIIEAICSILGIHSPSTEMIEVGKNIIDGLVNGIQNGISKVIDILKTIATKIKEFFGGLDWDKIFAIVTSVGMFAIIKKLLGIVDGITSPLEGLGDIFGEVAETIAKSQKQIKKTIKAFANVLNARAFKERAEGIKEIAISIAILAASVAVLSQINAGNLWKAVGVIATLAIVLGVLTWALNKIGDSAVTINREGLKLGGLKTSLIAIGAGLLLLSAAMRIMGGMKWEEVRDGFFGLLATVGIAALVLKAFGKMAKVAGDSSKYVGKVGSMMFKLALSMALMVGVIKLVSLLKPEEIKQGILFAAGFSAFLIAYIGIATLLGNNLQHVNKLGRMMMTMAISMALMVGVVKLISMLNESEIYKGVAGMAVFAAFVWALTSIVRKKNAADDILKVGGLLLAISGAMLIMVAVVKLIGTMSPEDLIKGGLAIAAFTGIIYLLVKMVKSVERDAPKIAGTLLAMSISIAILAGIAVIMSFISVPALAKGLIAVGMLGGILSLMIHATKGAQDVKGSIIAMAIAIGVMTASIALLSLIKPEKLVAPTIALGILMGMFALIAKSASTMTGALGPLIVMTVAVGLMSFVIWKLSDIPAQQAIGSATAIGILMLSMAVTLAIVNGIRGVSLGALISLGVMTLIVGALAQILIKMEELNPESALSHVKAISTLLLALSGACVILGLAGLMGPAAFVGIGALAALIVGIGGLIVAIGALVTEIPKIQEFLDNGIPVLEQIGHAIGSFFGNIVSGFVDGITSGLPQIGSDLSTFMTNLEPFVAGAKNIDETAMTGIQNIVKMLGLIAGASIIDTISTFLNFGTSPMESFAQQMNLFGDAIVSFSNKVKGNIDEESVMAAANAGRLLAEMQSIISNSGGIFQAFTGEKDIGAFGTQIVAFGDAIAAFSKSVKGNIDEEAVMAAANAGALMAEMQSKIVPSGGVFQFFTGEKDMALFAQQLSAFGDAICKFSTSVAGGINEEAVTAAANAGTLMSEMQAKIVPTGGVIQWFSGEKDMATFGTQLVAFGEAIVGFSKTVSTEGAISETAIAAAANAGTLMTELQNKVEPSGGVIDFFAGRDDLATFGTQLVAFGGAMVEFSKTVSEGMDEGAVTAAANAGKVMATLQKSIPEDKWLDGKMSLDDFGKKIKKFGGHLADYAKEVSEVDTGTVSQSITSANRLVTLAKNLVDVDPEGIKNFKIKSIGEAIKGYSDNVASIDAGAISNSISAANRLVKLINSMAGIDTSGVGSFSSAMSTLGKTNISGFVSAFSESAGQLSSVGGSLIDSLAKGARAKTSALSSVATMAVAIMYKAIVSKASQFRTGGAMLMMMLISGINSKKSGVSSAVRTTVSGASSTLRGYYSSFYNAGSYLVTGFCNGISANTYRAAAQGRAMAQAANNAARAALGIASPSKVFYKIGDFVVQGFTKALGDGSKSAYSAAYDMADTAQKGFSNAIGKVSDFLSGDMDVQPTIRPVLDLSDVRSGVGAMNGMFGMQPSVGVMSNLGAISSMMNSRNQNGVNDDVVSAIDKLSKRLGNVGNTSYTINGITYDDGSALQEAFSTIVRAAKMERRV